MTPRTLWLTQEARDGVRSLGIDERSGDLLVEHQRLEGRAEAGWVRGPHHRQHLADKVSDVGVVEGVQLHAAADVVDHGENVAAAQKVDQVLDETLLQLHLSK